MSGTEIAKQSADRGERGRFLPGHSVKSPGRPPGSLDLMAVARKKAREHGVDLEDMLWTVIAGLQAAAAEGDTKAAALLLDRFCGVLAKEAGVEVNINNGTVNNGPPEPTTRELGVYMQRLGELSGELLTVELEPKPDPVEALLA